MMFSDADTSYKLQDLC